MPLDWEIDVLCRIAGRFQLRSPEATRLRFTVRRRRLLSSPCGHRPPGGQDIARGVGVSVLEMPAGDAAEARLALATLRRHMATGRAALTRVRRRYLDNGHTGESSLLSKAAGPKTPAARQDLTVEARLCLDIAPRAGSGASSRARHAAQGQALDSDQVMVEHEGGRCFFDPILDPIGLLSPQASKRRLGPPPSARSLLLSGQLPLQARLTGPFRLCHRRRVEELPVARGQGVGHTPIDSDCPSCRLMVKGLWQLGESNVPAASTVSVHAIGLDRSYLSGPAESHPTQLGDGHLAPAAVETPHMPRAHGHDAEPLIHAFAPPLRPTMCASPEVLHRLGEVPKRLLLHRERARRQPVTGRPRLGQLFALHPIPRRGTPLGPIPVSLLKRQVPYKTGMGTMCQQQFFLGRRRIQAKPHHPILRTGCDISAGDGADDTATIPVPARAVRLFGPSE
jgi:hypothetical protein